MHRILLILTLLGFVGGGWAPAAQSQQPEPQPAPAQGELQTAEGHLSKLDGQQRLLAIKSPDGSEIEFTFTETTMLAGAVRPLQAGDPLKVHYQTNGAVKTAVRVEVLAGTTPSP